MAGRNSFYAALVVGMFAACQSVAAQQPQCPPIDPSEGWARISRAWSDEKGLRWSNDSLRHVLLSLVDRDQEARAKFGDRVTDTLYVQQLIRLDSTLAAEMQVILERFGLPTRTMVGAAGSDAAMLLVQHSSTLQERVLALAKAAPAGEISPEKLAMLEDRVLVHQGKQQTFGTQFTLGPDGVFRFSPVSDAASLDARRSAAGMPPMRTYVCMLEEAGMRVDRSSVSAILAIPFELDNNLIYVRVSVNGSRPLSFILDTGARSIISATQARSIGLKLKLIGKAGGVGANQPDAYRITDSVSFSLPGVSFSARNVVAMSLDPAESCINEFVVDEQGRSIVSKRTAGRKLDGILGKELFDRFVVEIDYAHRLLNVFEPSTYQYAGSGDVVPLEIGGEHIFARAQIISKGRSPLTGRFLIDTGDAQAVNLMKPFTDKHHLLPSTEGMTSIPACGLGGHAKEKSWIGTLDALQIGELKITRPTTEFRRSEPNTDADGFIGAAVFRRFKVIFDYSRHRMILESK